jgi:hypothetical protein
VAFVERMMEGPDLNKEETVRDLFFATLRTSREDLFGQAALLRRAKSECHCCPWVEFTSLWQCVQYIALRSIPEYKIFFCMRTSNVYLKSIY